MLEWEKKNDAYEWAYAYRSYCFPLSGILIERLNIQRSLVRKLISKYAVAVVYRSTFRCCAAASHTQPKRERPTNRANVQIWIYKMWMTFRSTHARDKNILIRLYCLNRQNARFALTRCSRRSIYGTCCRYFFPFSLMFSFARRSFVVRRYIFVLLSEIRFIYVFLCLFLHSHFQYCFLRF